MTFASAHKLILTLHTQTKEDKKSGALSWDVHFWLGLETTQDEAGSAAILTVQLDDLLGGGPVQHREVQEHESAMFLSYFKNSIRYRAGGAASGFHHVATNAEGEKRLFHVKGKRNVRVREVGLSFSNMNKGDCFILDAGREIYVYVGQKSKRVEKLKAISAANQIRDQDHNGRAQVHIVGMCISWAAFKSRVDDYCPLQMSSAAKPIKKTSSQHWAVEAHRLFQKSLPARMMLNSKPKMPPQLHCTKLPTPTVNCKWRPFQPSQFVRNSSRPRYHSLKHSSSKIAIY